MDGSRTRAGGCFLTLFILLGFLFGLSIRNPLKGVLIGLAIWVIGFFVLGCWAIYRIARGWMALKEGRPMPMPAR